MSWSDFMDTKHFGAGIFRPYADLVGDIDTAVDNLLGQDPAFAKVTLPLVARDVVLVYGSRVTLVCISRGAHRHYPTRASIAWDKFWTVQEEAFISTHPDLVGAAQTLQVPQLESHFVTEWNFLEPVCIGLPAVYSPKPASPEAAIRTAAVAAAAKIVVAAGRTRYRAHLEMQKPKDIFLSHKSVDKDLVREVAATLKAVGLSPWLDEDRMLSTPIQI